jgi:iron complex transport system substrate-binding protein
VSSTKAKVLVLVTAFGFGLAGLIYRCNEALTDTVDRDRDPTGPAAGPTRIAVLSSAVVELIFALGAGDRVVGVTRYARFPDEVKKLPTIGGVMDLSFERLSDLHPDLIIAQSADPKVEVFARQRRIEFMPLEIERIQDVLDVALELGEMFNLADEGRALAVRIEADLSRVQKSVRGLEPLPCFISVDRTPGRLSQLLSAGQETFLAELLELVGGRNVFGDLQRRYGTVSKEALVSRAPEVILELKPGQDASSPVAKRLIDDWKALSTLPAVQSRRIYVITHDAALLPGPRMAEVAMELAKHLHPEAFEGDEIE